MAMRTHQIHAATVHAPLALLPAAALVDLTAALTIGRTRRGRRRVGANLWWGAAVSGIVAGVTGLAASQEVRAGSKDAKDMMWRHGIINVGVVAATLGMAMWRTRNRPSVTQSMVGLVATAVTGYTAYLGGELVYAHGVGVTAMPDDAAHGVGDSPRVLSPRAPWVLLRDTVGGARWLLKRARKTVKKAGSSSFATFEHISP